MNPSHSSRVRCVAFDCFGTVFNMHSIPRSEISDYVNHVRKNNFTQYDFPKGWYRLSSHDDSSEGILMLQNKGYCCVALSNGNVDLIDKISKNNNINWDHIVDLVEHKVYKPNTGAYLTIKKDLNYNTENTLMITANPTFGDIEGAKSVGMQSQIIRHGCPNTIIELAEMLPERNKK